MAIQFAFDIGTNSIGWCVLGLDESKIPDRIIDAGVRTFSDGREPKSGTSLAEGRRIARGMSRRRDRYKRRRKAIIRTLVEYGLMPDDPAARRALVAETNDKAPGAVAADVYALRARALNEKLAPHHIGRALFHLNQRRGFKSNRKTDKRDNDQGKIAAGISRLRDEIATAGARTLGEYLHRRRLDGKWVRVRPSRVPGKDDKQEDGYGFYPERGLLRDEFDAIWTAQAAHYPDLLTEERRQHLETVIFHQRPLKPPTIGKCSFNPHEERLPRAHPLFQEFRLIKELNELEIVHRDERREKLSPEQRDTLFSVLRTQRSSQMSAIRKTLKAPFGSRLNKEREARDKMLGDEVAAEMSAPQRFGQKWFDMPLDERWAVIRLLTEEDEALALEETIARIEPPWPNFRDELKAAIERITVSHKPDHGTLPRPGEPGRTAGQLHNDTAFGFVYRHVDGERVPDTRGGVPVVVRRKPFMSLRQKDLPAIRDDRLRMFLEERLHGLNESESVAELSRIAQSDPLYKGIRHVRMTEVTSVIPIKGPDGTPYKGYAGGGNYSFDVWELPDGRWDAEVVSVFDAHAPGQRSRMSELYHNPRKVMSLKIGDMVAYDGPSGQRIIARVRKFDQRNKQIYLDAHNEAGSLDKRHKDPDDPFINFSKRPNVLRAIGVRQVRIDEIGQVFDPGPQDRESRLARKNKLVN